MVVRPVPLTYSMTIVSFWIRTSRKRPSIVSPSRPEYVKPLQSVSAASLIPGPSTVPMNFNGIGGICGGGKTNNELVGVVLGQLFLE